MISPSNFVQHLWQSLRSSLWFVPMLIVTGSILLAILLISGNGIINDEVSERFPKIFGAGAEGSRGLLTAVASSMITVAGVTFSITMVVLSLASNQYSPRILSNFMRDRFNQAVLGTFLGIYVYCLIVVRTIREGDTPFVPSLAVLGSLVLALIGVMVLISFIHHIIASIQAGQIISGAAAETLSSLDRLFPEPMGEPLDESEVSEVELDRFLGQTAWLPIAAGTSGYICRVDGDALIGIAERLGAVLRMEYEPGDFYVAGMPLASLAAEPGLDAPMPLGDRENRRALLDRVEESDGAEGERLDRLAREICDCFLFDRNRTIGQDVGFGILQIVDIALKALSPGMNETTTAVTSIHYLTVIVSRLAERRIETRRRAKDGRLRVIATRPTFVSLLDVSFEEIRRNAEGEVAILEQLLQAMETIGTFARDDDRRRAVRRHVREIAEVADRSVDSPADRVALELLIRRVLASLGDAEGGAWSMSPRTTEGSRLAKSCEPASGS